MDKTTADMILELIRKDGPIPSRDIAASMKLTQADVRYHITKLVRLGLIFEVDKTNSTNRGRPSARYMSIIANNPFHENPLFQVLLKLLVKIINKNDDVKLEGLINTVFLPEHHEDSSRTQRIMKTIQAFQSKGYEAVWEARPHAPIVLFHQCPYINLIANHPELCEFDRKALEYTLGCPVKLIHTRYDKIELPCQFSVTV